MYNNVRVHKMLTEHIPNGHLAIGCHIINGMHAWQPLITEENLVENPVISTTHA